MPGAGHPLKSRVLVVVLAITTAGAMAQLRTPQQPAPAAPGSSAAVRPQALVANRSANNYVDPALCAGCHGEIADSFARTGMGRSFYPMRQPGAAEIAVEDLGKPYYHAASDTYLEMVERGGKYYQRRWQVGFDGRETNIDEKQLDYVIGSGNHVRTYLHQTSQGRTGQSTLQQLPLSWYSEKGGYWAMSPGFDRADYPGSTRVVNYPCMFCHNAYPKIPRGDEEPGAVPEFLLPLPEGIDCQRCHGPGERHVQTAGRAGANAEEIRAAIVNPKRQPPDLELEVCMQCHLQTTALSLPHSIQNLNSGPFSFIPGQPMETFRMTFDRAGGMGDRFEIAHTTYRLRESQCFLQSQGKLRCTTCHDPHNIPRAGTAVARYNGICRDCHSGEFARIVASGTHTAAADCVSCHMPKRRTDDVVHVVMTDHLIQRRPPPGNLLADKPEIQETPATVYRGEVVPYYPARPGTNEEETSLYLALAQVRDGSNLQAGLPRLASLLERYQPAQAEFYLALGEGWRGAGELAKALPYYEEAVRRAPASTVVLRKLGGVQMESGQLAQAEATLRRVTELAPGDAPAWGMLGQVLWMEGRSAEGNQALTRAIGLDPEVPDLRSSLATFLLKGGDAAGAEKELREALRIQPGNAPVQANLASLLASRGELEEARYHFKQSIHLKPAFAEARLNYARLLAGMNETAEAQVQVEAAISTDGNLAGAHELLGSLLGTKGDLDGALRELQRALELQPDFGRAEFEIGVVLGRKRDRVGAIEHLKLAARSSDPEAKAGALDLLQKLGQ
jgi:predicted CXXCH cytochrome family protein